MAQVTELAGHVLGGRYRLVRAVSDGPRQVYEARHERFAGRFAAKLWPATTPWDVFRRGAELAVTLRHPGVMQVIDFNCEPGAPPFLVLEWVDGARLSDVIAESGIMPIERVAPLIESAAWALASAHQQGVVHLELRPDEVFVVHAPGTMREWVKLAGFGVSAALARAGTTPPSRYRAPELRAAAPSSDDEGDDPQCDQYSLAAIAYEMLSGVPPFDEERSRAEPLPISDLAPGVSPAVDAAIRQGLAAEPEQRFAGVLEFARALRDAVDGASPEALRRRTAASASPERRALGTEAVSPFFNPLQGRAGEVFRRVASSTARLRSLASHSRQRLVGGPSARIALAGTLLLLAMTSTAFLLRRHEPAPVTHAPIMAAQPPPAPKPPAVIAPRPAPAPTSAVAAAPPPDATSGADQPAPPPAPRPKAAPRPAPKLAAAKPTPKPAAAKPTPKPAAAKPTTKLAAEPCMMTVGSRPSADVWLDDHSLGRRTPLVRYRTACGDHKLALKRTDLDLYQMEIVTLRASAPFKKTYPLR